jgi:hypothetical protein
MKKRDYSKRNMDYLILRNKSKKQRYAVGVALKGRPRLDMLGNKFAVGLIPLNAFRKGERRGISTEFKKGCIPANKINPSIALRGENHPFWIKDRSKVKVGDRSMNDPLQKGWRKAVKDRDFWKCKIADENCSGKLEAHHILPWSKFPELRYQINNGITLCHHHHPRKMEDVEKLSPYFKSLVASLD